MWSKNSLTVDHKEKQVKQVAIFCNQVWVFLIQDDSTDRSKV